MKRWLVCVVVMACACPAKQGKGPTGGGSQQGSGTGSGVGVATPPTTGTAKTCDDVKPRVEQMYRAEGTAKALKQSIDEFAADNTTMVMNDCAKDPAKFVPCLAKVPTVGELEKQCLVPIDDEGHEGEAPRK